MKIMMLTNIFTPQIGGITRSIQAFTDQYRKKGHEVLVVAPSSTNEPENETDVVRYPAIPNAYMEKYSLPLPVPGYLTTTFQKFQPDIVHSHHPFLIGLTARRGATFWDVPIVYTHHTRYDSYLESHFHLPTEVVEMLTNLWTGYCNLCDGVIAPSESIAVQLQKRGVLKKIVVIPTGVDFAKFSQGDGRGIREKLGLGPEAFVVGHSGRLAPEKNCRFLARGVTAFLKENSLAHFLVAGDGSDLAGLKHQVKQAGVAERCHFLGMVEQEELVDIYPAMDVFAFASKSETQGMVLTEAMAAGVPVVALSASGVDDVLEDQKNGRLILEEKTEEFVQSLSWVAGLSEKEKEDLHRNCRETAKMFSIDQCSERSLSFYNDVISGYSKDHKEENNLFTATTRFLNNEWNAFTTAFQKIINSL